MQLQRQEVVEAGDEGARSFAQMKRFELVGVVGLCELRKASEDFVKLAPRLCA